MSDNLFKEVVNTFNKRKSIKHVKKRQNSIMTIEPDDSGYLIIPDNQLINCSEKECSEYDIYNEDIYKKKFTTYMKIKSKLEKSSLELKELPHEPPKPNNFERLIIYRKRNQRVNCLYQTSAIVYLLNNGYKLVNDITSMKINPHEPRKYFEAYQAIEFANELSNIKQEQYIGVINYTGNYQFLNNYLAIKPSAPLYNNIQYDNNNSINNTLSNLHLNNMTCSNPEHHSTTDKINFYDNTNNNINNNFNNNTNNNFNNNTNKSNC
jgi:hypothetical protein